MMIANTDIQKLYARSSIGFSSRSNSVPVTDSAFGRIKVVNFIALILTSLVIFRLVYMNTFNTMFLAKQMSSRIERMVKVIAMRGTIVDRNGSPLAVSTPVDSIWVDPTELDNLSASQLKQIAAILHMSVNDLNSKLNQKNKTFVYVKREVSPEQANKIKDLNIDGIYSIQEFKRYYPNGEVTAHVVGFNNVDDHGIDGIEYAKNKELIGTDGSHQILRDRQGNVVEDLGNTKVAQDGQTVSLSIDNRIQYIAYAAVKAQVEKVHAKAGSAVVLDAKTGEVLSMVNYPTYNPNNRNGVSPDMLKNRAITNVYDPGSIMKPIVIAKALDDKVVTPQTIINTHPYSVGPKLIKDDEPFAQLSVEDVLIRSSDIGTSKIALKYQPEVLYDYYRSVGLGGKLNTGFPGETNGLLLNWKKWHPIDQALNSFGYGISVSLLQMAHAYTEFTNEGCVLPVSFYKDNGSGKSQCQQVIKPKTADLVREILAKNTVKGTGQNAQLADYTTGGKTGTAQKIVNGHYSNHDHIASFVGFAPAVNPKIIVAVMVESPKTSYYGAAVAAPVFSQIAGPTLHLLGVHPDRQ
jgi:cell division protein FtsI (penicillin-binding protein 3)